METLLDPRFAYPDLVALAKAMVTGIISIRDGCALARKVTGGAARQTSVGLALVIGPQAAQPANPADTIGWPAPPKE